MSYEVGSTVLAISHTENMNPKPGERRKLFIFGEGVYVGDRLRPGVGWPCHPDEFELISTVVTKNDDVPIEEHEFVLFYDRACAAQPDVPPRQDRETMIADLLAERERPLEDRVRDLWEATNDNPCIYLDSGDIVYGFQSWWGPLDRADHKFPESVFERVLVPVPEGSGRWK